MAKSLLTFVNDVLKRVGEVSEGSGELTTFVDDPRQHKIDLALQVTQEVVDHVLSFGDFSGELGEGSITLAADTREYALETDFLTFAENVDGETVFVDQTEGRRLTPYLGGYTKMFSDQADPTDFIGTPNHWALNEVTGLIRVDRTPQTEDAGKIYKYLYNKIITLALITDTFPFPDPAVNALIPAAAELYRRDRKKSFDDTLFNTNIGRAIHFINKEARASA